MVFFWQAGRLFIFRRRKTNKYSCGGKFACKWSLSGLACATPLLPEEKLPASTLGYGNHALRTSEVSDPSVVAKKGFSDGDENHLEIAWKMSGECNQQGETPLNLQRCCSREMGRNYQSMAKETLLPEEARVLCAVAYCHSRAEQLLFSFPWGGFGTCPSCPTCSSWLCAHPCIDV